MQVRYDGFEWNDGNIGHCVKHGVSREEIEFVLGHMSFLISDSNPHEPRMRTAGRTRSGRHVFVVFTFRERGGERRIRPRYMHDKEVGAYERRTKT